MAVVGWMGAWLEVVVGKFAGQRFGRMSGDAGAFPDIRGEYNDYTRWHQHTGAQLWVGLSRNWLDFLERP